MSRRAIILTRISSDRADETGARQALGVTDQERDGRTLAERLDWDVVRVVTENDTSAFKRRKVTLPDGRRAMRVIRPGFRSVLDDLANGRADALIAHDLDRAVRDPRDLEDLIDVVEQRKIPVESVTGSLRLANDADITMARVMVAMANKASRDTARRVARAYQRRSEDGRPGGGKRMFGFERDGLTIRPGEAAEIVAACNSLLEGASVRELALDLRRRNVPTVGGGPWTSASLRRMLQRPRNAAIVVHRKERLTATARWDPIVTEDVYEAVVRILTDPGRLTSPGNTPAWLGSGIYRCACGGPMRVHGQGRYRCSAVVYGQTSGTGHTAIQAGPTDLVVERLVLGRLAGEDAVQLVQEGEEVDTAALRSEASTLRVRLAALAEDFADGLLDRAQLRAGTKRIEARLRDVGELLGRTSRSPLTPLVGASDVHQAWAELPLASRRNVIETLLRVDIAPAKPGRAFDPERVLYTWR